MYCVDLTLRDGVNLNAAITSTKQIDEQSKTAGFYQEALDQIARQDYCNASFEVGGEERLDTVEEFYMDEVNLEQHQQPNDLTHVQNIQKMIAAVSSSFILNMTPCTKSTRAVYSVSESNDSDQV